MIIIGNRRYQKVVWMKKNQFYTIKTLDKMRKTTVLAVKRTILPLNSLRIGRNAQFVPDGYLKIAPDLITCAQAVDKVSRR